MALADPDLHLFLDDRDVLVRERLYRRVQPLRRDVCEPALAANGADEGTAIGYSSVMQDPATGQLRMWYLPHQDFRPRLALSANGLQWERQGLAMADAEFGFDNLALAPVGRAAGPWAEGACWVGIGYRNRGGSGLYALRSVDGRYLEAREPGIVPGAGDRSSLYYDPVLDQYLLISRRGKLGLPGMAPGEFTRPRLANLWRSQDLIRWEDAGVILRYDDLDDPDVEIYGMQPFRCGRGFLAFVEMYHKNVERLDTQLAHSDDGLIWHRTQARVPVLPLGGEGAWDSHWAVPTLNPPIAAGERLLVPYIGAGTKHGSGVRHRRGIGLASIRRDGWVSLEAGRTEGVLVTGPLPLRQPMVLEVNANVHSGYLTAAVIAAAPGPNHEPVPGYDAAGSRIEQRDAVCQRLAWGERTCVAPMDSGFCHLRFTLYQGSLFSYRWRPAD